MDNGAVAVHGATRIGLAVLDGFLGLTAVLGGIMLVINRFTPPLDMLAGSPFASYLIPGLALLVLVGGGGFLASALVLRRSPWGTAVSSAAGLMVLIFEAVELVVIGFTWLLAFYVLLGVAILALAARLWLAGQPVAMRGHLRMQAPR